MPDPVDAIGVKDRKQLVGARQGRNHNGQDVILDQGNSHDQAEGRGQVAHRGGVRAAAFIKNPQRIHIQRTKDQVAKGNHAGGNVSIVL